MKANKFNKSKIMKEAHYLRNVLNYTMSEALSMAWRNAKTKVRLNEEAKARNEADRLMRENREKNARVADMSYLANTLIDYYNRSSRAYYGD